MVENRKEVEEALKNKEIDAVFTTKWPFLGEFLRFLEEKGVLKELKKITGSQKRKMLQCHIFVLLYIIKLIVGIPRIRGTEELLCDCGAMSLMGFDIDTLENGLCDRGDSNQHGKDLKKNHFTDHG